ncbi:Ig-like domain-containing protein [Orrella daihaiensis]|uniref:Bacterial Ig-like domain-containing protein n=1 Tax=Orrella daihaiensis TaxID=2782176 RepID=A0ABY4AJC3_9BURK|nr:Ig-like domain-containing protein [Orrella daihaiensis]UOD50386.1 hypothetical protein DHf2319_00060 [Orrella daihaiensis]
MSDQIETTSLNVIESIYTSPDYVGPDVPGLPRFVDPETEPETPVELPIVVVPQPDSDPVADTTPPAAPSPPDLLASSDTGYLDTDNLTNDSTPTFTGTAESGSTVTLYANGQTVGTGVVNGGNWSITSSTLADGVYTITAQATDVAGNVSSVSSGTDVTINTSAPVAAVINMWLSADTGFSPSDFVTNTASQTINGLLTQALDADETVQVSVDNGATWSTATVSNTNWTVANQTLVGSNTAVARVVDAAGNVSTAYSRNYVLDQTAPTISSFGVAGEEMLSFVSSEDGTAGLLPIPGQDPFYLAIPPITANQLVTMELSWAVNVLPEYLEVRDIAGNYSNSSETIFRGSPSGDVVTGTAGVDFMFGFEGNDSLSGGVGNDVLQGGSGADTLTGGSGADTLTGGADDDVFIYASIAELFSGGALVDSIVGGDGTDTIEINGLLGFTISATDSFSRANSIETITISGQDHEYNMSLTLNADAFAAGVRTISFAADENSMAQNLIDASRANSTQHLELVGSASPDAITAGAGNDTITGGEGNDQINPGSGTNIIYSGDGRDVITVNTLSTNTIHLLKGLDTNLTTVAISGGALDRTTTISAGTATTDMRAVVTGQIGAMMTGAASGPGATVNFTAGDGADSIVGTAGADTLSGGGGDDTIAGSAGGDIYFLGAGADTIVINAVANVSSDSTSTASDEIYDFGDGADLVRVNITNLDAFDGGGGVGSWGHYVVTEPTSMSWSSLKISPTGTLNAGDSSTDIVMRVFSSTTVSANDLFQTLAYDLTGTAGDNLLTGYDNSDTIAGGDGNDTITGGAGADWLSGGEGNDQFQFTQVTQFAVGETIEGGGGVDVLEFSQAGSISFVGRDVTGIEMLSVLAGGLNSVILTQGTGLAEVTGFDREDSQFYLTKHLVPFNAVKVNSTSDVSTPGQWTTAKQGTDFVVTYWDEVLGQAINLVLDGVYNISLFDPSISSQSGDLALQYQYVGA